MFYVQAFCHMLFSIMFGWTLVLVFYSKSSRDDILETISQYLNNLHRWPWQRINPNQTFSARVSLKRFENPSLYWTCWIILFETFWAGHLDEAITPDE